jgi:hypothetical protein
MPCGGGHLFMTNPEHVTELRCGTVTVIKALSICPMVNDW